MELVVQSKVCTVVWDFSRITMVLSLMLASKTVILKETILSAALWLIMPAP